MKNNILTNLLAVIKTENQEYGHRQFSVEFSHDGIGWEVRICDGNDDYEGRDRQMVVAIARAANLFCAGWESLALQETNSEVKYNLRQTAARFRQVAVAEPRSIRGKK